MVSWWEVDAEPSVSRTLQGGDFPCHSRIIRGLITIAITGKQQRQQRWRHNKPSPVPHPLIHPLNPSQYLQFLNTPPKLLNRNKERLQQIHKPCSVGLGRCLEKTFHLFAAARSSCFLHFHWPSYVTSVRLLQWHESFHVHHPHHRSTPTLCMS